MASKKPTTLKRKSEFDKLRKTGKKVFVQKYLILNIAKNDNHVFRFGWTLSRRVGSAVVRNKLKRMCRKYTTSRFKQASLTLDINFIFREIKDTKEFYKKLDYKTLSRDLDEALQKNKLFSL